MKSFSRILDWRSVSLILLLLHNVHPLKEAEFATEIPSPSVTHKVPATTKPEVTLLFEKVRTYVEKHKKGVAHKATIPIQEETQTDTNELSAPSTKRAKAVDSQNDAMRFGSVDDGNLKRFYESWLNLGKGQREPDEIEPGNFWKEDDDDSEQQKANLNSGWKDFLPKFDNSHFPGSLDHAHVGDRSDVDTFNVLLTGNTLLPHGEKANAILLSTQKNSLDNLQKLQETVNSAASSAIDENEQLQETLAQIIEEPGRPPYVSVLNSSISSLKELESTLEKLLGSRVILRVNGAENAVTGFIPVRQKSVIQDLLRKTDGLARSDFNSSEGKVNIVNIFIINILPKGVVTTFDEGIMSLPPSEKGSKDTYEADDSSFLISDSSNIPLDSFTSDYFPSVSQADERVPVNEVMDENLATLHDILIKLQDTTSPSSSVPDAANELNFQVASPQASLPQKHEVVGNGNSLRPKPSTYQLNPYGLNLNENNVLDLLPSFVRATTIAPIIPLNEASLHQNIGQKPSVLGLLPNQLFSISSPRFDSISNSTLGGITRKDFPTKETTSNAQDNFSSRQSELVMGSSSIDSSGNSYSVGKRNFFSNNNAGHPLLNMGNDERYPATFQQNSKPSSSVFKDIHPINLLNWVNLLANSKKENAKLNSDESAFKSEVVLKASNGTETELQRKEDSLVGGLDFDQIKRVLTIGALPGGLAFASALSPYWAPLVFGKRKKREAKNTLHDSFRYFYPHQENQVFQSSNAKENYPQVESVVYRASPKNDLEFNKDSKNIVDKRLLKNARSREHIRMNHQDFNILTSFVNSALATMESKSTLSQDKFTDDFGNELSIPTSASSSNYNSAPSGDKIRFE